MKKCIFSNLAGMLSILFLVINSAQAEPVRTGTNLNSKSIPSKVLTMQEPDEVESIRQQLSAGRKNEALKMAEKYLDKVERTALNHETLPQYYAWNAYCTVLTSLNRVDDAIAACTTAMAFEPGKWSAMNNRGTAKLIGGNSQDALTDYQTAMSMVNEGNLRVRETIQHNIALAMARQ